MHRVLIVHPHQFLLLTHIIYMLGAEAELYFYFRTIAILLCKLKAPMDQENKVSMLAAEASL